MTHTIQLIINSTGLLKRPVLWIPGIFAGIASAAFIFLSFSGGEFIAGKVLFLAAVVFPFFVAGAVGCMNTGTYSFGEFCRLSARYYFPVLLPAIITIFLIGLLLLLFSIPFIIAGVGSDPSLISGLFIGVTVPVLISAFFYDNAAVAEGLKVFASLKRSMVIASNSFFTIISCLIITIFGSLVLSMAGAMVWGMILADRFTPYLEMSMAEQQKVFSGFDLADWQEIMGSFGIAVTAGIIGVYVLILISAFIVFKQQCFLSVQTKEAPALPPTGEYDEKGRWYKY